MDTESYLKLGYCHCASVLDSTDIKLLRSFVERLRADGLEFPLPPSECLRLPEILRLVFNPNLISAIIYINAWQLTRPN